MCGNPQWGHPTKYYGHDNTNKSNKSFATLPVLPFPSCVVSFKQFGDYLSNKEPPTLRHHRFLPITNSEAQKTIQIAPNSNQNEAILYSQFEPCTSSSVCKRKYSFAITMCLRTRGLITRIHPLQPKHAEFLSMKQFWFDIKFDKFNFAKKTYEQTKEAIQEKVLEDVLNAGILEFLGRWNQVLSTQNIMQYYFFEHSCVRSRKHNIHSQCHFLCCIKMCISIELMIRNV